MTALKSRVRKKIEKANANTSLEQSHGCFKELSKLLNEVIEPSCRKRIMDQIRLKGPQKTPRLNRTNS